MGFIVGTCTTDATLTDESMDGHDPLGTSLCIHSVVTSAACRRKRVATAALRGYVECLVEEAVPVERIMLIAKAGLLRLYVGAGFGLVGLSEVVHGADPWFELAMPLTKEPLSKARATPFVQVDAFTTAIYGGNPAAVVFTHRGGDADWMQRTAEEFNLSDTAFVQKRPRSAAPADEGVEDWDLRWFTPKAEVDLCGHATLGAAHAIFTHRADAGVGAGTEPAALRFHTLSGLLTVTREGGFLSMDFPSEPVAAGDSNLASNGAISEALFGEDEEDGDENILFVGRNRLDLMVEVTPEAFASIQPDMAKLAAVSDGKGVADDGSDAEPVRGVVVTAAAAGQTFAGSAPDFISRCFFPNIGVDEDPVTGSAHCGLAPYWAAQLGKNEMLGYQASTRGGEVRVKVTSDGRVVLGGRAVTVMRGDLAV